MERRRETCPRAVAFFPSFIIRFVKKASSGSSRGGISYFIGVDEAKGGLVGKDLGGEYVGGGAELVDA